MRLVLQCSGCCSWQREQARSPTVVPDGSGHPEVGALLAQQAFSDGTWEECSGTLIAPRVFLTAAHCDEGVSRVAVTFDSPVRVSDGHDLLGNVARRPGLQQGAERSARHGGRRPRQGGERDHAGTASEGRLVERPRRRPAVHLRRLRRPGGHERPWRKDLPLRRHPLRRDRDAQLDQPCLAAHLAEPCDTANGGTCYGDSGGPNFLGAGSSETNILAGTTITGRYAVPLDQRRLPARHARRRGASSRST